MPALSRHAPSETRILQQNSLAQHWAQDWARDWRALALTQVHHWSRLSDSGEDGEALSSVHSTALAVGKLIHNLLCDGRVKNDWDGMHQKFYLWAPKGISSSVVTHMRPVHARARRADRKV